MKEELDFIIISIPVPGSPIGRPVLISWPPRINGVALWGNGTEEFGRKRRTGERITESYEDFQDILPNAGGPKLTKWIHLDNKNVEVIERVQTVSGLSQQGSTFINHNIKVKNEKMISTNTSEFIYIETNYKYNLYPDYKSDTIFIIHRFKGTIEDNKNKSILDSIKHFENLRDNSHPGWLRHLDSIKNN